MAKKNFTSHLQAASRSQRDTETYVKDHLQVDAELQALIPPLGEEELAQLEQNVLQEGIREPLIVWKSGESYVLVDGHNRYALAQRHRLDFRVQLMEFDSRDAAQSWMIGNQLGRRNLSPEQQSYLRGKRYEAEKKQHGGDRKSSSQNANLKTSDALAATYSVSKDTILRDARFAQGIDLVGQSNPELRKQILTGKAKVRKADLQQLAEMAEQQPENTWSFAYAEDIKKLVEQLRQQLAAAPQAALPAADIPGLIEQLRAALDHLARQPQKAQIKQLKKLLASLEKML